MKSQTGFGLAGAILVIFIVAITGFTYLRVQDADRQISEARKISSFDECVASGKPVMETYPEQCTADGQTFTRELTEKEKTQQTIEDEAKSSSIIELGDNGQIVITSQRDLELLDDRFPASFKQYMDEEMRTNSPDADGCVRQYTIRRVSGLNISGAAGSAAVSSSNESVCGGGAAAFWYLKDGSWQLLGLQDAIGCNRLSETTLFKEFIPTCIDSDGSGGQLPNPNGSIEDA